MLQLSGHLVITGSSTQAPMISAIAKRFQTRYPAVSFDVRMGGSGRGIADVSEGKADIGMVSRTLTDAEGHLYSVPFARDGVAVVVHKTNAVNALSNQQIVDIFTGKITNWKQAGGSDMPIMVAIAEPKRASSELFKQYFHLSHDQLKSPQILGDNSARIKLLKENPNAILYLSLGETERSMQAGVPIKALPIDGVAAVQKNIRNSSYPITRALILVTKGAPQGLAKEFIEYTLSSQVTDLILSHDFVPYLD